MGYPKTLKEEELQEDDYEYGLEQTYYQMKNTNKQDTLDDYTYVKIETNKNKNIADQGNFKGRGYKIYEKEAKLKDQELKYTYKYGAKGNQKTPIEYNEQITGMTLLGEVEKTDKEEVNINLRIDKGKKGQYPYPFRPETGNMLYNMPQKGTTVSLYMPNHDERFAMIINSIRQNTSQDMTDPSKRTFTTEHGKKLDLYPNQIKLQSKTTGTKISLDDPDAINLNSHKNINIIAKEEILLKAKVINIDAKEELNLIKGDALSGTVESSITQSTEIDKKAKTQTKATGTDKAAYPQIEDAPPEEEKGNAWVNFAIGGLATVGLVVATIATGGLAGGLVALALGGAALGVATATVAMTGEAKPLGEAIKEMAIGAVTGAIGGALPGSTAVWIGIGGGIEGIADRFLRGEKTTAGNLMQDIFLSMVTAGILDNVARKIKKAGAYKVVKERVGKRINKILEPVTDTFKRGSEKETKLLSNNADEMISKGLSNTKTKYAYNMIENPGPLAEVRGNPASNFISGKYNIETLDEDIILYRSGKEGGLTIPGKEQNALGQWFTREPAESVAKVRIDSAVKAQWIDPKTGVLTGTSTIESTYAIKIPKGTIIYEGPVGYQGGIYLGGENCNQIFVSEPWKIHDVKPLSETPIK